MRPALSTFYVSVFLVVLIFVAGCASKGLQYVFSPVGAKKMSLSAPSQKFGEPRNGEDIRLYNRALEEISRGRLPAAESLLMEAVRRNSELFPAHEALGRVYEKLGEKAKAAGSYRRVLKLRPAHVKSHIALGRLTFAVKNGARSIFHLEKAIALRPDSFKAHYQLGLIRRSRHQMAMAVYHFKAAVRISPRHRAARYWLWLSVAERGGADKWEVELGRKVVEEGNNAPVRFYRGRAGRYFWKGRMGRALRAIKKAVDVNPRWREKRWGGVLADMARYRRALKE